MLAIQLQTVALTIGRERTLGLLVGALVPIDTEPLEIVEKLVLEARLAAREIGVLNAQHHDATGLTGEEPVKECSAGVADMQLSCGRRSEANADLGSGAHPLMLARAEGRKPFGHGFTRMNTGFQENADALVSRVGPRAMPAAITLAVEAEHRRRQPVPRCCGAFPRRFPSSPHRGKRRCACARPSPGALR